MSPYHAIRISHFQLIITQWSARASVRGVASDICFHQTIIEVDGNNVFPLVVDSIQIYAGQRYSFVLHADQHASNYWVRALPNVGGAAGFTGGVNSAILRYAGAPVIEPVTPQIASILALNETQLHPLVTPAAPGPEFPSTSNITVFPLAYNISLTNGEFTVNSVPFESPSVPVLLQILSGAQTAQTLLPSGSVYALPPNRVIEINIPGGAPGAPVSHLLSPHRV